MTLLNLPGTGVITGTPPNLVVLSTLDTDYGSGKLIIFFILKSMLRLTWFQATTP